MSPRPDFWKVYECRGTEEDHDLVSCSGVITNWDHIALILAIESLVRDDRYETASDVANVLVKLGGPRVDTTPPRHL